MVSVKSDSGRIQSVATRTISTSTVHSIPNKREQHLENAEVGNALDGAKCVRFHTISQKRFGLDPALSYFFTYNL